MNIMINVNKTRYNNSSIWLYVLLVVKHINTLKHIVWDYVGNLTSAECRCAVACTTIYERQSSVRQCCILALDSGTPKHVTHLRFFSFGIGSSSKGFIFPRSKPKLHIHQTIYPVYYYRYRRIIGPRDLYTNYRGRYLCTLCIMYTARRTILTNRIYIYDGI